MPNAGIMASAVSIAAAGCTDVLKEPFDDLSSWATTAGTPAIKTARTGTGVELIGSFTTIDYSIPLAKQADTITVGFAFKSSTMTSSGPILMLRSDNAATDHTRLNVISDGSIITTIGTSGITPSAAGVLAPNTWAYIEIQSKLHDTAGYHIVRVNNKIIFNTGLTDTKNGGTKTVYDTIRLIGMNTATFDDLYISTGASCSFKGDMQIIANCTEVLSDPMENLSNWTTLAGTPTIVAGKNGNAIAVNASAQIGYTIPSASRSAYLTTGFAFKTSAISAGQRYIVEFYSAGNATFQNRLVFDGNGALIFQSSPLSASSPNNVITTNTWYYIEIQQFHDDAGWVVIRVNGNTVINTNGDTRASPGLIDTIKLAPQVSATTNTYDDFYLTTGQGCVLKGDPGGCNVLLQEPFDTLTNWPLQVGSPSIESGSRNGNGLLLMGRGLTDGTSDAVFYSIPTPSQDGIVTLGFAWKVNVSGVERLICQLKSETIAHIELSTNASNGFNVHRGTSGGPVIDSSAGGLWTTGTWYYLEIQAKLKNVDGFVKVSLNGTLIINQSNVDTRLGGTKLKFDQVALATSHTQVQHIDDLYLSAGGGCAFQGDHQVINNNVLQEKFNNLTAWTVTGSPTIVSGRTGNAVQFASFSSAYTKYTIPSASESDTIIVGFAFKAAAVTGGEYGCMSLLSDAGATVHSRITINGAGQILFYRASSGLWSSPAGTIVANTWCYIEIKAKLHDSTGLFVIRVNGNELANVTNTDTKNGGTKTKYDSIQMPPPGEFNGQIINFDDLYIATGTQCTFQGDHAIT